MRCAECKHWKHRHGNWGKCVRLSKWQGSPLVIMDDRGNGVETEIIFGCVCHEERTTNIAEKNGSSHNKQIMPCCPKCGSVNVSGHLSCLSCNSDFTIGTA